MTNSIVFSPGNYRFVPGVFQYSGGVAAEPGYRVERVQFSRPVPLREAFELIREWLTKAGRPLTALCACELRSPAPLSEHGFTSFNTLYADTLGHWGIFDGKTNPVARSNVCPEVSPPSEPCFHAFSYTVPDATAPNGNGFVIAGSSEVPEGKGNYYEHIVSYKDLSEEGLRNKARWVLEEMERRMNVLGFGWKDATATQLYTVHNIYSIIAPEIAARGAMPSGLTWHFARPPVEDMEYEMDCRDVQHERILAVNR